MHPEPSTSPAPDDLLDVELQIARRADQLAMELTAPGDGASQLYCWLRAEREVFGGELQGR